MSKDIKLSAGDTIMNAEDFYREIVNPSNKTFIIPSWVIDFAEKYADYKAAAFHRLTLKIQYENSEQTIRKVLKQIDNEIDKETLKG